MHVKKCKTSHFVQPDATSNHMSFMNKAQSKEIMQELDFESDSSKTEMKKRKRSIQNNKNINDKKKKLKNHQTLCY